MGLASSIIALPDSVTLGGIIGELAAAALEFSRGLFAGIAETPMSTITTTKATRAAAMYGVLCSHVGNFVTLGFRPGFFRTVNFLVR
jgi:hypothetical protein